MVKTINFNIEGIIPENILNIVKESKCIAYVKEIIHYYRYNKRIIKRKEYWINLKENYCFFGGQKYFGVSSDKELIEALKYVTEIDKKYQREVYYDKNGELYSVYDL